MRVEYFICGLPYCHVFQNVMLENNPHNTRISISGLNVCNLFMSLYMHPLIDGGNIYNNCIVLNAFGAVITTPATSNKHKNYLKWTQQNIKKRC